MGHTRKGQIAAGRRTLLRLVAAGAGAVLLARGASWLLDDMSGGLAFTPIAEPEGFRRLSLLGATSSAIDPFAGLETDDDVARPESDGRAVSLCRDLFGTDGIAAGIVPIAFFLDFNCPNCDLLVDDIETLRRSSPDAIHVTWHQWPILGAGSEISARAALAADLQGAREGVSRRLQRTIFQPTPAYLRDLARSEEIDPDRFLRDMQGDEVSARLAASRALVRLFGFPGTPAFVVGRTVVIGTIRPSTLAALVTAERALGPPPPC